MKIEEVDKEVGRKLKEWERWLWLFWKLSKSDNLIRLKLIKIMGVEEWKKGIIWASHFRRWGLLKRIDKGVYIFNRSGLSWLKKAFGEEILKRR